MKKHVLRTYSACLYACMIVGLFAVISVSAQDAGLIDASKVPATGDVVDDFIPNGWQIEDDVAGDLNDDGTPDHAITLIEEKPAKDGEMVDRGRALVIVFGGKDKLTRAAVAGSLLQCTACGGAFYGVSPAPVNVSISKGVLIIQQDHGSRWVTDTTFRFRYDEQPSMFILIGFDYSNRDRAQGTDVSESINYLTGKRIATSSKGKKTTTTVAKKRLSLEEVDSSEMEEAAAKRLGVD